MLLTFPDKKVAAIARLIRVDSLCYQAVTNDKLKLPTQLLLGLTVRHITRKTQLNHLVIVLTIQHVLSLRKKCVVESESIHPTSKSTKKTHKRTVNRSFIGTNLIWQMNWSQSLTHQTQQLI